MLVTKQQNYKCSNDLPNLVSTVLNMRTVTSQYLFASADTYACIVAVTLI